jgi:hypothetical protein
LIPVVASLVIFLFGLAVSQVFALKVQTEFYLQIKKKRLGML